METLITVYMDHKDVTPWVVAVEWGNDSHKVHRSFSLTLKGWDVFTGAETFDIFGSYDAASPRMVPLIREGVMAPDKIVQRHVAEGAAYATVTGYDKVWLATRRKPRETIVMTPSTSFVSDVNNGESYYAGTSAVAALRQYGGTLGSHRVWTEMRTMHIAAKALARRAGFSLALNLPDYPMQAKVFKPEQSYWDNVLELLRPYAVQFVYRRDRNLVIAYDPLSVQGYGQGRTMQLGEEVVKSIVGSPTPFSKPSRVIVRVPSCH